MQVKRYPVKGPFWRPSGFAGSRELKSFRPDRFTGRADVLTPIKLLPHLMDFFGETPRVGWTGRGCSGNEITLKMLLILFGFSHNAQTLKTN